MSRLSVRRGKLAFILAGTAFACLTWKATHAVESEKTALPDIRSVFACSSDGQYALGHEKDLVAPNGDFFSDPWMADVGGLRYYSHKTGKTTKFPNGVLSGGKLINVFLPKNQPDRVLFTVDDLPFPRIIAWDVQSGGAYTVARDMQLSCVSANGNVAYAFSFATPSTPYRFVHIDGLYIGAQLPPRGTRTALQACSADGSTAYGYVSVSGNFSEIVRYDHDANGYSAIPVGDASKVLWPSNVPVPYVITCSDDGRIGYSTLRTTEGEFLVKLNPDLTSDKNATPSGGYATFLGCTGSGTQAFGVIFAGGGDGFVFGGDFARADLLTGMTETSILSGSSDEKEYYGNSVAGGGTPKPFLFVPDENKTTELGQAIGADSINFLYAASRDGDVFYCRVRESNGGDAAYVIERGDKPIIDPPPGKKLKKENRTNGSIANYYAQEAFNYSMAALSQGDGYGGNGYYAYLYSYYSVLYSYYSGSSIVFDGDTGIKRGRALQQYLQMRAQQTSMSYYAQYYSYQQYVTAPSNDALMAFYLSYYAFIYGDADLQQP